MPALRYNTQSIDKMENIFMINIVLYNKEMSLQVLVLDTKYLWTEAEKVLIEEKLHGKNFRDYNLCVWRNWAADKWYRQFYLPCANEKFLKPEVNWSI